MPLRPKQHLFPRWLIALVGMSLVAVMLYALRGVLTPIFFAFLIAYMLDPVVDQFEARNVPRSVGIAVMLTVVLGALALFLVFAVPGLIRDVSAFASELPATLESLRLQYTPLFAKYGITLPSTVSEAMAQIDVEGAQLAGAAAPAGAALKWILGGTATVLGAVAGLVMIPVFAAYLLYDFDRITAGIGELVPPKWRPYVIDVAQEIDQVLGGFIRGQLVVMLILAVAYAVAYSLLGVRLAVMIGVVAGLLSFIPYVGGAVALGLALLMSLLDWGGWGQLLGVVAAYSAIQVVESFVITPRVVGEKVGLSAIWVLFALMVGGELFGFLGVLMALPAAAVAKIFVLRGLSWYRETAFFASEPDDSPSSSMIAGMLRAEGLPDSSKIGAAKRTVRIRRQSSVPPGSDPPASAP